LNGRFEGFVGAAVVLYCFSCCSGQPEPAAALVMVTDPSINKAGHAHSSRKKQAGTRLNPSGTLTAVEGFMNMFVSCSTATMLLMIGVNAVGQSVTPIKGQSPETVQLDINACTTQTGGSGTATSTQSGGRVRGAAKGAAAGAVVAQSRGNRNDEVYDRLDDDVKQDYRQNKARDAAVAGVVVGGSRQRQERRKASQTSDSTSSAYATCMQQRGYQVTP
jgi:hypothetical protein